MLISGGSARTNNANGAITSRQKQRLQGNLQGIQSPLKYLIALFIVTYLLSIGKQLLHAATDCCAPSEFRPTLHPNRFVLMEVTTYSCCM